MGNCFGNLVCNSICTTSKRTACPFARNVVPFMSWSIQEWDRCLARVFRRVCRASLESQYTLGTGNIVAARPLDSLSNSQSQGLERGFGTGGGSDISICRVMVGNIVRTCGGCFRP